MALWWADVSLSSAAGATASIFYTWQVFGSGPWQVPSSGGPFVMYYLRTSGAATTILGTSNTLVIAVPTPAPTPTALKSSITIPSTAVTGVTVSGSWSVPSLSQVFDWVAVFRNSQNPLTDNPLWWNYVPRSGLTTGTFSTSDNTEVSSWVIPNTGGTFLAYYFCCNSAAIVTVSNPLVVQGLAIPTPAPVYVPKVDPSKSILFKMNNVYCLPLIRFMIFLSFSEGDVTFTVSTAVNSGSYLSGIWTKTSVSSTNANALDWIGLYQVNQVPGQAVALWWDFVAPGQSLGTFTTSDTLGHAAWQAPASSTEATYIVYYFCCNSYVIYAITSPITLSASAVTTQFSASYFGYSPASYYGVLYSYTPFAGGVTEEGVPTGRPSSAPTGTPTGKPTPVQFVTITLTYAAPYIKGTWFNPWYSSPYNPGDHIALYSSKSAIPGQSTPLWVYYVQLNAEFGSFNTGMATSDSKAFVPSSGNTYVVYYFLPDGKDYHGRSYISV